MMDFYKMPITCKLIGEDEYQIKVGNDYIEVFCNIEHLSFPSSLNVILRRHYIGEPGNHPTNHGRTTVLLSVVTDYFKKKYLEKLEEEIKKIANLPAFDCLEESWMGKYFYFSKGTPANVVYNDLSIIYDAYWNDVAFAKSFYDISLELNQAPDDGFLSKAIRESLSWI